MLFNKLPGGFVFFFRYCLSMGSVTSVSNQREDDFFDLICHSRLDVALDQMATRAGSLIGKENDGRARNELMNAMRQVSGRVASLQTALKGRLVNNFDYELLEKLEESQGEADDCIASLRKQVGKIMNEEGIEQLRTILEEFAEKYRALAETLQSISSGATLRDRERNKPTWEKMKESACSFFSELGHLCWDNKWWIAGNLAISVLAGGSVMALTSSFAWRSSLALAFSAAAGTVAVRNAIEIDQKEKERLHEAYNGKQL